MSAAKLYPKKVTPENYWPQIKKDLNVDDLMMDLEDSMLNAAQKLNFEKAALIRDQIDSIKKDKKGVKNLQVNGIKNSFRKKRSRNKFTRDGFPKKKRK